MSANHYRILGVSPDADGPAIRSAYRALMRVYHPDRNDDSEAQSRAREITAAFAILGDPEKRAAYDAQTFGGIAIGDKNWFAPQRRAPAPLRKVGLACVAVTFLLSLALVVQPQWPAAVDERPATPVPAAPSSPKAAPAAPRPAPPASAAQPSALPAAAAPAPTPAPRAVAPSPPPVPKALQAQPAVPASLQAAQAPLPKAPPSKPAAPPAQIAAAQPPAPPAAGCAPECGERRAKVERMAKGFLQQSIEHADWKKQQLLLSARMRSQTSRTLCRTDDCVTEAYLRQIRETTAIMAGRIPNP